jgi:hypothetical protein
VLRGGVAVVAGCDHDAGAEGAEGAGERGVVREPSARCDAVDGDLVQATVVEVAARTLETLAADEGPDGSVRSVSPRLGLR